MAKNLNSVSFTLLLLVLAMASTGILKSEAAPPKCPVTGTGCVTPKFYGKCGQAPFIGTNVDCCTCCLQKYGSTLICGAIVEGTDFNCHCYSNNAS